ncbi:hypothetical protein WA026_003736 [Henosepilachna vigintioctopunctata]
MDVPSVILNNGNKIPSLGLGTYMGEGREFKEAVKYAIDIGYRHIDTAMIYGNEKVLGEAIREKIADGTVTREDLFITSKLWNCYHDFDQVVPACKRTLKDLGLDYVDLYLIHWPVAQDLRTGAVIKKHNLVDTWKGMEECYNLGLAKNIGVSNFSTKQMLDILEGASVLPVMHQIEVNPHLTQKEMIGFCKERNIAVTAYTPFGCLSGAWNRPGQPNITFKHPTLIKIAKNYGKTTAQVILRYLIEVGTIPIPKSINKNRIKENLEVFDFKLKSEEIAEIDALNKDYHAIEVNRLLAQKKMIRFREERDITVDTYTPFGCLSGAWNSPGQPYTTSKHPTLVKIAKNHGKTTALVILRYLIQVGKLESWENKEVYDFELKSEEIAEIDAMNKDYHDVTDEELDVSDDYPFKNEIF